MTEEERAFVENISEFPPCNLEASNQHCLTLIAIIRRQEAEIKQQDNLLRHLGICDEREAKDDK